MGSTKTLAREAGSAYPSRRAQRFQQRRVRTRRRIIASVCGVLALVGVVLIVMQMNNNRDAKPSFAGSTIEVVLGDYTIDGNLTAPAGEVRLHAVNNGGLPHDVGLRGGPMSNEMRSGLQTTVDLGTLAPGTYQLYCNVEDHEARGMVANLVITAPIATATT
jgi:manganese oxidase